MTLMFNAHDRQGSTKEVRRARSALAIITVTVGASATISHTQIAGELKIAVSLANSCKNPRETKEPIAVPTRASCTAFPMTLMAIRQRWVPRAIRSANSRLR